MEALGGDERVDCTAMAGTMEAIQSGGMRCGLSLGGLVGSGREAEGRSGRR